MHFNRLTATVATGLALLAFQAHALDDRWYETISTHYTLADDGRRVEDAFGMGLTLGKPINPTWNLEGHFNGAGLDGQVGNVGQTLMQLSLDGLYFFDRNPSFAPYAVLGAGAMRTKIPGSTDYGVMANAGVGLFKELTDMAGVRLDARYRWDDNAANVRRKDSFGDWIVSLGLNIAFGAKAGATAPVTMVKVVESKSAPVDSDGDGVTDDLDRCHNTLLGAKVDAKGCEKDDDGDGVVNRLDQCPGTLLGARVDDKGCEMDQDGDGVVNRLDMCPDTPAGSKVDNKGCVPDSDGDGVLDGQDRCPMTPAGAQVDAKGCEMDQDGDGVVDRLDYCPGTPDGRKVDANGCELDGDRDGVVDALDRCTNTPAGDRVDSRGCTLLSTIILEGVNFDRNAAEIRPDARPILDDAVATLKRYPQLRVEVAGHTDSRHNDAHNQALSQRRAQAVHDYFVRAGIDASRLTAKGYGESQPIAENGTEEGRQANRRVELRIQP